MFSCMEGHLNYHLFIHNLGVKISNFFQDNTWEFNLVQLTALYWKWRIHMSKKYSSGTPPPENNKQTNFLAAMVMNVIINVHFVSYLSIFFFTWSRYGCINFCKEETVRVSITPTRGIHFLNKVMPIYNIRKCEIISVYSDRIRKPDIHMQTSKTPFSNCATVSVSLPACYN